jgi:hypothetical protein
VTFYDEIEPDAGDVILGVGAPGTGGVRLEMWHLPDLGDRHELELTVQDARDLAALLLAAIGHAERP